MASRKKTFEKIYLILFILLFFGYIALLIPQMQKLYVADEICFVRAASGVVTAGIPIYADANNEIQYGLWHPSLYVHILGASFKLFGIHEWSARMVSVFFTLATLFIIYLFTKDISNNNRTVTFLSCFLFLYNPLIMQGSLLIDIDNSVLMFLMTLFIYIYFRFDKTKTSNLFLLGILFGIVLWAKLPSPPVLLLCIMIFNFWNKNIKNGLIESLTIGAIGAVLFLSTWFIYCAFLDLPLLKPFMHSSGYLNLGENNLHFLLTHLWGLKNIIFWANPFFIFLVFIVSVNRLHRYLTTKQLEILDLLLIIGLSVFFQYLFVGSYQTQDFPRYFIPMIPLFSIVVADFIGSFEQKFWDRPLLYGLLFLVLSIYILFVLGDPLLMDRIIFNTGSIYEIVTETAQTFLLYLFPFVISYFLLKIAKINNTATIALVISLIACNVCIDVIHSQADYSTGYFHGERGMDNTIKYLKSHVNSNDTIISRDDVAYYLSVDKNYPLPNSRDEFDQLAENKNIKYIIINKEGYFTTIKHTEVFHRIDESFELNAQFGDFKILKNIKN